MPSRRPAAPKAAPKPEMGAFHRQLEQPEVVGEITVSQASEIKALNELIKRQEADVVHAQRTLQVMAMHKRQFLSDLVKARDLVPTDIYNFNDDTGQILRTHELVQPTMEVIEGSADAGAEGDGGE